MLIELVTFGGDPYPKKDNAETKEFVMNGGRPNFPKKTPELILKVMDASLQFDPKDRPTFPQIVNMFNPNTDASSNSSRYQS